MKKYALLLIFIINTLNGMNHSDRMQIALHDCSFAHFLNKYNLPINNPSILHIGCSTGNVSAKLAQKASRVHAFDTDTNCINIAKNDHCNLKNIFFEYCSSTHFDCPRNCDLAVIDYTVIDNYTNTNQARKALLECVNQHLSPKGEMFISIATTDNTLHPTTITALNMSSTLKQIISGIATDMTPYIIRQHPSTQDILTILDETGFQVTLHEEQTINVSMKEEDLCSAYINIVRSNPIFTYIQDPIAKIELAQMFIASYINTLKKDKNGRLLEPMITTIIRARKK